MAGIFRATASTLRCFAPCPLGLLTCRYVLLLRPNDKFPIQEYKLIYGDTDSFTSGDKGNELIKDIMEFLGKKMDKR